MKDIINFCESNNHDYVIKTLRSGLKSAVIKTERYSSAKKIHDMARENKDFYAEIDYHPMCSGGAVLYIYNSHEWEEMNNKRMGAVTVTEMQTVTNELISLGYGNYSVAARVPLDGSALMYPSWDAFVGAPCPLDNEKNKVFLDLEPMACQIKVPKKLIEWAESSNSNPNVEGGGSVSTVNFLNETLSNLINSGFSNFIVCRTSFKAGEDKYDTFVLGQLARVDAEKKLIFLSLQKV